MDAHNLQGPHPRGNLTREEEVALFTRWRQGDASALEEIVRRNLGFANQVALEYFRRNKDRDPDELMAAAMRGLHLAALRFDTEQGFKFISYAVWWIRQQILLFLHEDHIIVPPWNTKDYIPCVSLDEPFAVGGQEHWATTRLEFIPSSGLNPEEWTVERDCWEKMAEIVEVGFSSLKLKTREVLCSYYGIGGPPMTLEEIGTERGLTKQGIQQIKAKGELRMASALRGKRLLYREVANL